MVGVGSKEAVSLLRNGIFAVNKLRDITSAELLNRLKTITWDGLDPEARPSTLRMGHGGTLDRSDVGVLVVGVNWGCKYLPLMLNVPKNYIVVGQMGIATDTFDEGGNIIDERLYGHVRECDLQEGLNRFIGETRQVAPLYKALKIGGQRMSDLARARALIRPKERKVLCYSAECTDFNPPFFTLQVRCGGGFYIRSLVNDIGRVLNTCAHVRQLQRTQQGPFTLHDCLNENEWTVGNILDSILMCQLKFAQYASRMKSFKQVS